MKVTASSELMMNHVAGKALQAQRSLGVASSTNQTPMLFSIDEGHSLRLTLPSVSSTTGWTQLDLGGQLANFPGLGAQPAIQCFTLSQDADGSIWLVLAAAPSIGAPSQVFLSKKMPNTGLESDWSNFSSNLVERPIPDNPVVSQLILGTGDDTGEAPVIVAVVSQPNGPMMHYQINPDPNDNSWPSQVLILPQDATACRSVAVGNIANFGRGIYALCELGTALSLTFITLPQSFQGHVDTQQIQFNFPEDLNPQAIASLSVSQGETELYVAGDGVYRYPISAQSESNLSGESIADATLFNGVLQLTVSCDSLAGEIGVWGESASDLLVHTVGTASNGGYTWETPVYLATEVTAMASYRAADADSNLTTAALAIGKSDGSFALMLQEPATTLWRRQSVSLQVSDTALELATYTTRILVEDDDGLAWADQTVEIKPIFDCAALVNGQYYALKSAVAKPVQTSGDGTVTIVLESPDLAAPTYELTANGQSLVADPGSAVKTRLRAITGAAVPGDAIANAVRSDGKPLFANGGDETACGVAASALGKLLEAHDSLPADGAPNTKRKARLATVPVVRRSSLGVRFTPNGPVLMDGDVAMAALAPRDVGDFFVAAGDLFQSLESKAEEVGQFFVNELEEGWEFVVDLGKRTLRFVFEAASQAMAAINWVFKEVLGISLSDLIAWLGFMFDWDDIRQNHRVIAQIINLGFAKSVADIRSVQQTVSNAFDTARNRLLSNQLIVDQSNAIFSERARQAPRENTSSQTPQSNWGSQQLSANAAGISFEAALIGDLERLFSNLAEEDIQIVENAIGQIQSQLINNFNQMTVGQILDEVLQIVIAALINSAESIALVFLAAVEILVNAFQAMLNTHWQIPVITYVYEEIICKGDGSKLTMLDVISLLTAIPVTVMYKAATGNNLFSDDQAKAILAATSWDALMAAMGSREAKRAPLARSPHPTTSVERNSASQAENASVEAVTCAIVFQCLAATARTEAFVFYILREAGTGSAKDRFNEIKVGLDWATYFFSLGNMSAVMNIYGCQSDRCAIDSINTTSQVLVRCKDSYLAVYKRGAGEDAREKDTLCKLECVFGVGLIIATCISVALEVQEDPPDGVDRDKWNSVVAMKFIQNLMTGFYRTLAFVSTLPEGQPKKIGVIVRGGALEIRALAGLARAGVEAAVLVADYD